MDVLEHLMEEHRKVEALLSKLKSSKEGSGRDELLSELKESLTTHMAVEERFIYPLMAEVIDEETATEATDEHALARDGLAAAEERAEEGAFEAAIEVLTAGISHHVEEEETELFPKLRERAADRLAEMEPEELEAQVKSDGDGATRDELYQRARQADIPGRSDMSKGELAEALKTP
jgi:iron-sulfur cluster repair protein YtfE (RIC family)